MSGGISNLLSVGQVNAAGNVSISLNVVLAGSQSPASGDPADINDQLDEVRELINLHEPSSAKRILSRLYEVHRQRFTSRVWYRYHANLGHALRMLGHYDGAAMEFHAAVQFAPDPNEAHALEVLEALASNDLQTAHALADKFRQAVPNNIRAIALWLQTAPDGLALEDLEREIPSEQLATAEVLVSLSMAAAARQNSGAAENYARLARTAAPTWLETQLLLAETIIQRGIELSRAHKTIDPLKPDLKEARDVIVAAIDRVRGDADPARVRHLRFCLAVVFELLGEHDRANEELNGLARTEAPDAGFAINCAQLLAQKIELMRPLVCSKDVLNPTKPRNFSWSNYSPPETAAGIRRGQ